MGLGGIIGGAIGALSGIPGGSAIGGAIGGAIDGKKGDKRLAQFSNPANMINIRIPGFEYPKDMVGPTVDMPVYSNLPQYNNPYMLPSPEMQQATIGEQGARKSTNQSMALLQAMLDPSNPISKNLVDAERQSNRASFLQGLNDVIKANRRQRSLGRTGFISPERMDEGVTGSLMRNAYSADLQAKQTGRDLLSQLSGDMRSTAGAYGNLANMETGRRENYMRDLLNYINMQRQDYTTGLNMQRTDLQDVTDQRRLDIINALNLYRGNQATAKDSRTKYLAQSYGTQAIDNASTNDIIKGLSSLLSSSGNTATPWVNPDYVNIG